MGEPREEPGADTAASPASIVVQRRIEWSDTDASGHYHNTAAFRFMEVAETTLLERLGFVHEVYGRHPRVHIEADFLAPLAFRDLVDIELTVAAVGRTSVTYDVEMRTRGRVAVRARFVAVLMTKIDGTPTPWPDEHRQLLLTAGVQPPERLEAG